LPEELPAGPFDLIVCSEVLYYWSRDLLLAALPPMVAALAPGGSLLAVHWRPGTRTYPLLGDEVHDLLAEHLGRLDHALSRTAASTGSTAKGVKTFCSGAGGVQRALVLARGAEAGPPLLVYADLTPRVAAGPPPPPRARRSAAAPRPPRPAGRPR
jgi:SAM-dependent methyltransferase